MSFQPSSLATSCWRGSYSLLLSQWPSTNEEFLPKRTWIVTQNLFEAPPVNRKLKCDIRTSLRRLVHIFITFRCSQFSSCEGSGWWSHVIQYSNHNTIKNHAIQKQQSTLSIWQSQNTGLVGCRHDLTQTSLRRWNSGLPLYNKARMSIKYLANPTLSYGRGY